MSLNPGKCGIYEIIRAKLHLNHELYFEVILTLFKIDAIVGYPALQTHRRFHIYIYFDKDNTCTTSRERVKLMGYLSGNNGPIFFTLLGRGLPCVAAGPGRMMLMMSYS